MILIVDMNVKGDSLARDEFVAPIGSAVGEHEVRHYRERVDPSRYNRVLLSGTPLMDNGYMEGLGSMEWLRSYRRPVLGICAGMHVLASLYGSKLEHRQEIGMTEIETIDDNPLFKGKFNAYEMHSKSVKPSEEFDVLAKSASCVQAIKLKNRPHYGVMFHPEVRNREILERFTRI